MNKIEVIFDTLGYSRSRFFIRTDNVEVDFLVQNKTIDDIQHLLLCFCDGYNIDFDILEFYAYKEVFKAINQKTLSGEKTVFELFETRNIYIKEYPSVTVCGTVRDKGE